MIFKIPKLNKEKDRHSFRREEEANDYKKFNYNEYV